MAGAIPAVGDGAILNDGDADVVLQDGLITIVRRADISGTITYRQASRAVPGADVTATDLTDGTQHPSATGADGSYVLASLPPGEYLVSAVRSTVEEGAVDPLDVSDILRSLVGSLSLSADERLVADVSGNGRVGTTDASLILRYIVGLVSDFPAGPFWLFEPEEGTINLLGNCTQNFTAFLRGDVNGDWEAGSPPLKPVAVTGPRLWLDAAAAHGAAATGVTRALMLLR